MSCKHLNGLGEAHEESGGRGAATPEHSYNECFAGAETLDLGTSGADVAGSKGGGPF